MAIAILLMLFFTSLPIIMRNWKAGIYGLICFIPYGGVLNIILHPSPIPTLYKDIVFVLPTYLSFLFLSIRDPSILNNIRLPKLFVAALGALIVLVIVHMLNPSSSNIMVSLIGLKTWLLYVPMIILGAALTESHSQLIRLLRLLVVLSWLPCLVGIIEFLASSSYGYENVISNIYGDAAAKATQNFQTYEFGISYFRIPSTFVYWIQYSSYTLASLAFSISLLAIEEHSKWKRIAQFSVLLTFLASLMAGAKANFIFAPMLIALYFTFSGRISSLLITTIIGLPIVLAGLSSLGINFFSLYELMSHLLSKYGEEYVLGGILDAMNRTYSGLGTGMNTGPARHAFSDPASFNPIENFYAKSIIELGIPGLIALCILFAFIALYCILAIYSQRDRRSRGMLAALAALIITIIISSLKGWLLDVDPFNLYFWLLIGVIFRHLPVNSTHTTRSKAAL